MTNNPLIPGNAYMYDVKWIVDTLTEAIELYQPLNDKFDDLKAFVNNYFDNLDLSEEVSAKIDAMRASGFFDDLIYEITITDGNLQTFVTNWLNNNVDPVGSAVVVDNTLSITGAAADAAAVGYINTLINRRFNANEYIYPDSDLTSGTINDEGVVSPNPSRAYGPVFEVTQNCRIYSAANTRIVVFGYNNLTDFNQRLTPQVDYYDATAGQYIQVMVVLQTGEFVVNNDIAFGSKFSYYQKFDSISQNDINYSIFGKDYPGESISQYDTTTPGIIYDLYDSLMVEFPDRISKTLLSYDESNTFPIYRYDITPPPAKIVNASTAATISNKGYGAKTILLTSGTHGNGANGDNNDGILALYHFINYYLHNSDYISQRINNALAFIVVPCVNPWGVANNSRYNSRDVDINRNFQYGWTSDTHSGTNYYSEIESRNIRNLFESGADLHVEIHTRGGNTQVQSGIPLLALTIINSPMMTALTTPLGLVRILNNLAAADINVDERQYGQMDGTSWNIYHIPSTLIECAFWIDGFHSALTDRVNTQQIGNIVYYLSMINDL